jgi:hypothetical protein
MKNDAGVSTVVSVMLILAILAICMASFSATYLPGLKQNAEILHSEDVEEAFMRFSGDVDSVYALDRSAVFSETFKLGGGDILLSPSTSSGTVEIQNVSLGTLHVGSNEIALTTVNVSYTPYLTVWKPQGYLYEKGLVWVTLGSIQTPAYLTVFDGDSYADTHTESWIDAMKASLEIGNNTATITLTNLNAEPKADYVTGSGSVKLDIAAAKNQTTLTLASGETIRFNEDIWYTAANTTAVTLTNISGTVSVR